MIKLIEIYIEEFRGIKQLTLYPKEQNFVIYGPNGSGKSGVVDAIDFGLTGNISRLAGKGTASLSLKVHGPHVDVRDNPNASMVRLTLSFPKLNKIATIERRLKKPKELVIVPDDPDIRAALDQVSQHSELTLSRREIIKYVLSEGSTRSKDVQALLKLDDLGHLRATFKTSANKLSGEEKSAGLNLDSVKDDLQRHLNVPQLTSNAILDAINAKRKLLGLVELADLVTDTQINAGLALKDSDTLPFSRATALSDLATLKGHLESSEGKSNINSCIVQFDTLKKDPTLIQQLKREDFYKQGLDILSEDEEVCPFCDTKWEFKLLVSHLQVKIGKAKIAQTIREDLMKAANSLREYLHRLTDLLKGAVKIAQIVGKEQESSSLGKWVLELRTLDSKLMTIEGMLGAETAIRNFWSKIPSAVIDAISVTYDAAFSKPDNSAEVSARDFLIIAQERLKKYRLAQREVKHKKQASLAAKIALKEYSNAVEETLGSLYNQVESKLADYYCFINHDDEAQFRAKLEHKESVLNLEVDFYNRGLFPPGAYHSEGHQDSMGLCLYLALMQQLWVST